MALPQSDHFALTQLADGVYAAIAADEGGAFGNTGIIDLGDQVLLFDSCVSPQAARDLYHAAQQLTGCAPSHVILSHGHIDHYQGACGLPASIDVVSTPETRLIIQQHSEREALQKRDEIAQQLGAFVIQLETQSRNTDDAIKHYDTRFQIGYIRALIEARYEITARIPDTIIEKSKVFQSKKRQAVAITYGGGHSPSDVILHLPDDNIIFTGDLITVQRHPFLGAGNMSEWLRILGEMETLNAEFFVPGHGPVGTLHDLAEARLYINTLIDLVDDHIHSGGTSENLVTLNIPERFCSWYFGTWIFGTNLNALFTQRAPKSVIAGHYGSQVE